jgi:hypothetical protein
MTTLYNETHEERCAEYITCLDKNLAHPLIRKIHVLYDTAKDDAENKLLRYVQSKPVTITYITGRPTYGECFELANNCYPRETIILSNADIYFNHTLQLLVGYDLHNKFLALTRWDVKPDGLLEIFKQYCDGEFCALWSETSQDAWIFQTPLKKFNHDTIRLGTMTCDSLIAYQAYAAGLEVSNPCLSVQACHLHLSAIRNYDPNLRAAGTWMAVPWSRL